MNKNRKKNKISIENIRGQHYNHRLSDGDHWHYCSQPYSRPFRRSR